MRIVVTGATSFVGAETVKELLKRDHEVFAVVRPGSPKLSALENSNEEALKNGNLHILENDLASPWKLAEKIKGTCDVFCHFGWGGSGSGARTDEALQDKNKSDSLNTIRTAKDLGCRKFLFSGSQAEYGMHSSLMTEETECAPRSLYGEAKLCMRYEGESLCKELGLSYIHVRIFSVYGPGDHPWTLVKSCLDAFTNDREMRLGGCTQKWNFLYITDLARAICALAETKEETLKTLENPVFNLAGNDTRVLREFVEEIHMLCKGRGTCAYGVRAENAEGAVNLLPDIGKICRVTGWKPETDFKTGIIKTLEAR